MFFCLFIPSSTYAWQATVLRVIDGDTLEVAPLASGEKIRLRLHGIDTPEGKGKNWEAQPFSYEATSLVNTVLPQGSFVSVIDTEIDRYGRIVGYVVSLPNGAVLQEELLAAGLAWVDPRYCKKCVTWQGIMQEAQEAKRGLWQQQNPVQPWEWRSR